MKNDDKLKNIKESLLSVMREPRRWLLLVGTGASVAMDAELGMPALSRHLLDAVPKNTDGWANIVEELSKGVDLETALTNTNPSTELRNEIVRKTTAFVTKEDAKLRDGVLAGKKQWVVEPLLRQLMRGLSPIWPRLPIVTPNYDMLIEYACSKSGIPYITGYHGGIMRRQDWSITRERFYRWKVVTAGGKRQNRLDPVSCVELMKVHGSINLFRHNSNGTFVENNIWTFGYPDDYAPMISPPGDTKTQEQLNYYERLFGEALKAIEKATAFFVVGYGFRDKYIHQRILDRVCKENVPLVVLTLDHSKELSQLPDKGDDVWVITGKQDDTGKTDPSGTRFAHRNSDLCGDYKNITLWQSDVFANQILGG